MIKVSRFLFLVSMFCFVFVASAMAGGQSCYTKAEAEAEQGIRIHSELMVIGLNAAMSLAVSFSLLRSWGK